MAAPTEDRREVLLEAGLNLLAEKPFSRITMNDIAEKSGVTKPMVYYYFESKEGFYRELAKFVIRNIREQVSRSLKTDCTLRETFVHYAEFRFEFARTNPKFTKAILRLFTDENAGEYIGDLIEEFEQYIEIWNPVFEKATKSGEIRPGISTWLVVEVFNSVLTHFVMHEVMKDSIPSEYMPDPEEIVDLVFRGIESDRRSTE
jgi:AcrR family transcriptional regulator